jgi:UDP-N-acetylmuramate dehydrogenase
MKPGLAAELARRLPERVRVDEPLARYTTYRIGGPAAFLVEPARTEDVVAALELARAHGVPWLALGLGSNVLVSDRGFAGVVIRIGRAMAEVDRRDDLWRVGAGLPTPLLARRTAAEGWAGVHRLIGVPGTVGGGVYMNAGAHGQDFASVVRRVEVVTAEGAVVGRDGEAIPWRYRNSGLGPVVVVSAELALVPGDPDRLENDVAEHLRWRKAGTPFSEPCCGSVFRNPVRPAGGDGVEGEWRTAGQLIDAAGMKGFRIGGAEVSPVHANYIVNTGGATADDVRRVIDAVRSRVSAQFGIDLVLEVKLVGGD